LYKDDAGFLIVGYSFGSLVALKIISTLESLGKYGKAIIIDGAPKFLKKLTVDHLPKNFTEEDIRSIIMVNTIYACYPDDDGTVVKAVLSEKTWGDRIKKFIELYPGEKPYSEEYGIKIINALVNRIMLTSTMSLKEFPQIKTAPLTLIRTTEPTLIDIEKDYALADYFMNVINVTYLEGNHATVLDNPKLSETINGIWD
jgi:fatty acid synthase